MLDREFEGLKATASTGKPERAGGGFSRKFGLAGGMKLGEKLHIVGSVDYNRIDEIQRDPTDLGDWFQRYGFVTNPAWKSATATPGVPQRLTLPNVISSVHSPYGRIDTAYTGAFAGHRASARQPRPFTFNNYVFTEDGKGVRPFVSRCDHVRIRAAPSRCPAGRSSTRPPAPFNGGPYAREVKEPAAFLGFKYDVTDRLRLFTQAMYGVSESNQYHERGLPHLQDIWFGTIYSGNPYLPAAPAEGHDAHQGVVAFKMLKLGQFQGLDNWADDQTDHNVHTMFTYSFGGEMDLWSDWQARINWQNGRSHRFTQVKGDLRGRPHVPRAGCGDGPGRPTDLPREALQPDAGAARSIRGRQAEQVRWSAGLAGRPRQHDQRLRAARCRSARAMRRRRRAITSSRTSGERATCISASASCC